MDRWGSFNLSPHKEHTMFHHAPAAGPRPALATLPPTLQPHAIQAMAPQTDRVLTRLAAGFTYCLLAAGVFFLARATPGVQRLVKIDEGPEVIRDVPLAPPVQAQVTPKPAETGGLKGSGTRPADAPTLVHTPAPDLSETPSTLQTTDVSNSFDPGLPVAPAGAPATGGSATGGATSGTQDGPGTGSSTAAMEITFAQVHITKQVDPVYPYMAKVAHVQGDVVVQMTIDTQGVPSAVQVVSGPAPLQAEALRAAKLWRFSPATMNGQAVPATFKLLIKFQLG